MGNFLHEKMSMLGYLQVPYLVYLAEGLLSNKKLFVDDTSLFSVIYDIQTSAINLNKDLDRINKCATQ